MAIAFLILTVFGFASASEAQPLVTETEFLEAVARDDRIEAILAEPVAFARADRARAGLVPNIVASFDREAPDGGPKQNTWSASWSPPLDGRRGLAVRAADASVRAAELDVATARVEFRSEARAAFAQWSTAFERARMTEALSTSVAEIVRTMEERARRGEASGLAARRLALADAEHRAEAARAAAELDAARATVSAWFPSLPVDATPARPTLPPALGLSFAADSIPSVQARRMETQAAEASLRLRNRLWEMPELAFGWQMIREAPGSLEGPVFGVRWPLPLFDRGQGERTLARERLAVARSRHDLAAARAKARLEGASAAYGRLRDGAESMRDITTISEQTIRSATAMFDAGESDVTDLLETLRGALSGFDASLDLFARALDAHRELELAAGRALPLSEGDSR